MASPTSVLSKTLQSITVTKIKELEKQRSTYEARKSSFLAHAGACNNPHDRLSRLLDGVKELYPAAMKESSLLNIERWLDQSRYDCSISQAMLQSFEGQLRKKLDVQSRRLALADLYSRLLTEWMSRSPADSSVNDPGLIYSEDSFKESFEVVERQRQRLEELVDKFEKVVFEPLPTSEAEMTSFLNSLFPNEEAVKALQSLREKIAKKTNAFMAESAPFTQESLIHCVKGLLTEDLLTDEKQAILRDFLDSPIALTEISDVLNMRFADLRNWNWDAGKDGLPVLPRQQLNGKYRIWTDDGILEMLFVQYICIRLCNILKASLADFVSDPAVWSWGPGAHDAPQQRDLDRRQYFLGSSTVAAYKSVQADRRSNFMGTFFLSQLPAGEASLYEGGDGGYDGDGDGESIRATEANVPTSGASQNAEPQKSSSIKQKLLRQLTCDLILQRMRGDHIGNRPHGQGAAVMLQTDLQWFATGLPHSTIFAVMRYVGFSEDWIRFLRKYLEAPLNLDHSSDHRTPMGRRVRRRGVPMAHASEKLTGELILFFLDLTVNRRAGMLLYRLHDDIWLCGEPAASSQAWKHMQEFAKVFGLEFNRHKTGSVYLVDDAHRDKTVAASLPDGPVSIGFLQLHPRSGKWVIEQAQVDAHVKQLQQQLADCDSILGWVQTWNSCIGRFFGNTFGEPAHCFGPEHVNEILTTYDRLQHRLFAGTDGSGESVVEHLKQTIAKRFGVTDIPDAFFFLPEHLGGLGLRNPFVGLFLVRGKIDKTPEELVEGFLQRERQEYLKQKKSFEEASEALLRRRLHNLYPDDGVSRKSRLGLGAVDEFMPLEEFARYREMSSAELQGTYTHLMSVPEREGIALSKGVERDITKLEEDTNVGQLDAEKKWILQLYADELMESCGSLSLVDKQFLPVGVLNMMKGKKVTWKMVL